MTRRSSFVLLLLAVAILTSMWLSSSSVTAMPFPASVQVQSTDHYVRDVLVLGFALAFLRVSPWRSCWR